MSLLSTRALSLHIPGRTLVSRLTFEVERGQLWCVLGPNGAGKTTLLHALAGLRRPDEGEVWMEGQPLHTLSLPQLAGLRGLMVQQANDAFSHTALDAVLCGRAPHRLGRYWDSDQDRAVAHAALERAGMAEHESADVLRLSGGERQRVALATLLAQDPALMLLDEPVSHQDVAQQLHVMDLVSALAKDHAVVMTCHDLNLVARYATHVLIVGGAAHHAGPVREQMNIPALEQAFGCRFEKQGGLFVAAPKRFSAR